MPVEETANMLIMADAYMQHVPMKEAAAYANAHYAIFKQWATYLTTIPAGVQYPNALDPQFQNQTDDFTGPIAHSVNLALKGIEAVGAMGQIAKMAGNGQDANYFTKQAESMIVTWAQLSQNTAGNHLLLQYREPANAYSPDTTSEPDSFYSLKYNAYPDKLLGLNLIPQSILTEEAAFYKTQETIKGIPLDPATPTRRRIGNCGPRPRATIRRSSRTSSTRSTTTRTRAPRPLRSLTCTIRSSSLPVSVPGPSWAARSLR